MAARRNPSAHTAPGFPIITDLGSACGRYFALRDFIEAGETWADLSASGPVDNIPRQAETVDAIRRLCHGVLDPLVDHFGPIRVTYGFAARPLTKHIRARIAPALDQHSGSERSRGGRLVCSRRGQAIDFIVPGVPSQLVARWIATETPFDRLYFYATDRPVHVSVGPDEARSIVWVRRTPAGRMLPHMVDVRGLPEK